MWRSFVIAVGLSMCLLGGEFMVVDQVVMANNAPTAEYSLLDDGALGELSRTWPAATGNRVFIPPDWAPWGLLSAGAMTVLYGATLSRQ